MSDPALAVYEIALAGHSSEELTVLSLDGREAINGLYAFDVFAWARNLDARQFESSVVGQRARLTLRFSGSEARVVQGIVSTLELPDRSENGRHAFRVTLVPTLWRLGQRTASRIFQEKTVQQITDVVLDEHGVAHEWHLLAKCPTRDYCVQYQESDLQFVTRILAEQGIFSYFVQPLPSDGAEARERLVLADSAHAYPAIDGDPALVYRPQTGDGAMHADEAQITGLRSRTRVAPTAVFLRDQDFQRPRLDLSASARAAEDVPRAGLGVQPLEVYDHHAEYNESDANEPHAATYLEQLRAGAHELEGASVCRRLLPGHRFELHDHDLDHLNRAWVVTEVEHHGITPEGGSAGARIYKNLFRCVAADLPHRPPRPARVLRQVTETAIVVGPPGQEIHTDVYGRVKVLFAWDREGRRDEHSSCWLRVAQAWAGAGFGHQFTPRVGMEVLVSFLGGDQDRPIVVGCLYNGENAAPIPLPKAATQSAIRTRSTPGGRGFNELRFEDRAGAEEISVHAERDLTESVLHDHAETVGHDYKLSVGGLHYVDVRGDRVERVAGALRQVVEGGASVSVSGDTSSQARGSVSEEMLQNRKVVVHGTDLTKVLGGKTTVVEGPHVVRVEALHTLIVGEGREDGQAEISVTKKFLVSSSGLVHVRGQDSIVLASGDSEIRITPSGIVIKAKSIELVGSDSVSMSGPGPAVRLGKDAEIVAKSVKIYSDGASVELDQDAAVNGKRVLLNCDGKRPQTEGANGKPPETQKLSLKLSDEDFKPYASKKYRVVCDGEKFEGTTTGDGEIAHDVAKGAKSAQVTLWLGAYPTGPVKRYAIEIKELPDPGSIKGAQVRLKNLGYYTGAARGDVDDETREALRSFQRDQAIKVTGELDEATKGKLASAHGS